MTKGKINLSMTVTPEVKAKLEEMRVDSGFDTTVEVLRHALSRYQDHLDAKKRGGTTLTVLGPKTGATRPQREPARLTRTRDWLDCVTPGPWSAQNIQHTVSGGCIGTPHPESRVAPTAADLGFIVAARKEIPWLVQHIDTVTGQRDRLQNAMEEMLERIMKSIKDGETESVLKQILTNRQGATDDKYSRS